MGIDSNTLQHQTDAEKQKLKVEYAAVEATWSGRGNGLWANAAIGLALGAGVGLAAPFFPVLAGAQTLAAATALIPSSLAIFSAVGMGTGFTAGLAVGTSAGAAALVITEQERRNKTKETETSPDTVKESDAANKEPAQPRSFWKKLKDGFNTYFNFKVGAAFAVAGAIGGVVMAAAYIALGGLTGGASAAVPALGLLLGGASGNAAAVTAYFAGIMGCFGATWAVNVPKLAADLMHVTSEFASGKLLGTQWGPESEQNSLQTEASAAPLSPTKDTRVDIPTQELRQTNIARPKFQSFQALLAHQSTESTELLLK